MPWIGCSISGNGKAALGTVEEVITSEVLSALYGAPIDVLKVDHRLLVVSGHGVVEADAHRHELADAHGAVPVRKMFEYEFMRTAFVAGQPRRRRRRGRRLLPGAAPPHLRRSCAVACRVCRRDRLGLVGINPLWGLLAFTLAAAVAMGFLGDRLRNRDVAVGVILSLALGFGVLFLYLYTANATEATAILFGNVLAVDPRHVLGIAGMTAIGLLALALIARPFCSPPSRPSSPTPRASRCVSSRCCFWRSSRSPSPRRHRSSACCWCSR